MKNYDKKHFFGTRKDDNTRIYLSPPSWDCGWYWGFGYLGNKNEHYHLDGYQSKDHFFELKDGSYKSITERRNICMYDALLADYELNPKIKVNLWVFCEFVLTAYTLKKAAELLGRGGSHMTTNPCADVVKNQDEVKRINETALPAIFDAIEELFKL